MKDITVMVPFVITKEFVDDVMCTALEGGITHWCGEARVLNDELSGCYASDVISRGGTIRLFDVEDTGTWWDLNLEKFIKGYEAYAMDCKVNTQVAYTDPADIDSCIADTIIQYAVFDEIVFG